MSGRPRGNSWVINRILVAIPVSLAVTGCWDNNDKALASAQASIERTNELLCELSLNSFISLPNESGVDPGDIHKLYIEILDSCHESIFLGLSGAAPEIASAAYDEWKAREDCVDPDAALETIDAALEQKSACAAAANAAGLNPVQRLHTKIEVCENVPDLYELTKYALACSNAVTVPNETQQLMRDHVSALTAD